MNISIVIPNYNGEKILHENLRAVLQLLLQYKKGEKEVIVIDDASTDTSVAIITQIFAGFSDSSITTKLIQNETNVGFAPTVNKGVTIATGDVVVLLNTDVIPESNFLEPLLAHFSDETVFAVGCLERSVEGETVHLYGRGLGKWEKGFLVHRAGEITGNKTLWVSCGSGAFKKELWDTLGGLNEVYAPYYWEDIDLSYRALKCGYNVVFEQKSVVTHKHEDGAIKKTQKPARIRAIATRNQILFAWNNLTDTSLLLTHFTSLPLHLARAVKGRDIVFILGFLQAVSKIPQVIAYRVHRKGTILKSDTAVIQEVTA